VALGFEYVPLMLPVFLVRPSNSESEFKRHIESRGWGTLSIQLDAGEIVKRISTAMNQGEDSIEPPLAPGNLKNCLRDEAESRQSSDPR